MTVSEDIIGSFHQLVLRAFQREARELESLRTGVGKHQDFCSLDRFREEWFTPTIFKELYRGRGTTYEVLDKPDVSKSASPRPRGKLDLRLTDTHGNHADFEFKGWWPTQTNDLVKVMRNTSKL